ncbi:MAG TPA: ATP-binding protein, partial [Candidatus Kapabacteria bacterium]|nr:ATP-binding protein [Candidatus Kapabacteria bacterium]
LNPESPQEKPIDVTNSITLSPNQNFFSIEFAGLYYANPGKNRYRYKLQGFENTWIEANAKNRRATYTNLPAGDYKFVVSASNRDGKWSQVDASITISIKLPSEKATWAYLIYSLLAFVFIGLFWSILKDRKISQHNRQLLVITRDLEKKVEERTAQLIHTEKMSGLGRLVSSVAHEINNPTAIMITAAYNLKKRLDQFKAFLDKSVEADDDPEIIKTFDRRFAELHDSLKSFNDGAQRIYRIVTDLRTFYRKDSGEKKHFHPNQGLQATLALVEPKYRDTIEFKTDFQEDAIIDGYPDELNQVFMNLITNSCQAIIARQKEANPATSPKTGILTVCTQIKAEYLLIGFQDNGIGMTKEVREKMFEPFFTDKPVGEGTGIGLSISYEIIKKHDGKIEVDYSEPGKGTTIHVFLPLPENEKEKMETKKEAI